ncbi:ABC transporter substrate-binding protein [Desulfonema magnum]|uniref:ABC transporter, substrate-binding protein n=1 Tax=Desulfonema magnum TaxID=45655 RepID=A0A975BKK8_9BACT|nr:ABC transporter substrate binding protein [Desulfonema magnum]QTA87211.1 putative ABC transporter, substrate-binding protein [Desulfonema magnum]
MKFKYLHVLWLVLICLSSVSETAAEDTYGMIKSKSMIQTNEITEGFVRSFPDARFAVLDMNGKYEPAKLKDFLKREKPSVIICLGALAAETTIQLEKKIPVIFAMVINYRSYSEFKQKNVTGVSMEIPPASLFIQFRMLAPRVRSLGVPFHPDVSAEIVREASDAAKKMGIRLTAIPVKEPKRMTAELSRHENAYDGLWMLGDVKLYSIRTHALSNLVKFSTKNRKPLLAFSDAFLKAGAFFSVSVNYGSLGSQLAMISRRIVVDKVPPASIPVKPPVGTYTVINREASKSLFGKDLDKTIYERVDKVYPE